METINSVPEFKKELAKYNTHIVDGQLCMGGVPYLWDDENIYVYCDRRYHTKYIIFKYEEDKPKEIQKLKDGEYTVTYDSGKTTHIKAYNRKTKTIPANKIEDIFSLVNKEAFDPSLTFTLDSLDIEAIKKASCDPDIDLKGRVEHIASLANEQKLGDKIPYYPPDKSCLVVVGLDLYKFDFTKDQQKKIMQILNECTFRNSFFVENPTETLCLIVNTKTGKYMFGLLEVNTFRLNLLDISYQLHSSKEAADYARNMMAALNKTKRTAPIKIDIMKELGDLISSVRH